MITLPLFPLQLFPLPGELVPLHIFEPRYRQLLDDAREPGFKFGILLQHKDNKQHFGSTVMLERIVRRHPAGESDIIIKALDFINYNLGTLAYRSPSVDEINLTRTGNAASM